MDSNLWVLSHYESGGNSHVETLEEYNKHAMNELLRFGHVNYAAVFISTEAEINKAIKLLDGPLSKGPMERIKTSDIIDAVQRERHFWIASVGQMTKIEDVYAFIKKQANNHEILESTSRKTASTN